MGRARATRRYHSPLRERQAQETRTLILESLATVIAEQGAVDFAIEEVATKAEVATRTVYRHFPNREELLNGLTDLIDERFDALTKDERFSDRFASTDDLLAEVPHVFAQFEELEPLTTAMMLTGAYGALRSRRHDERTELFRTLLADDLKGVDATEREAVFAVSRHLVSAQSWFVLREEFGLDPQTAGRTVARTVRALLADARERSS